MQHRLVERVLVGVVLIGAVAAPAASAVGQKVDSARTAARTPSASSTARDAVKPPISPKRAFLYSLVAPGYGQSVLDRPIAGAMFAGAEMAWIALATKSAYDLRYARAHRRDSLVVEYAFDTEKGTVKVDSLGRLEGATYAPNRYGPERVAARRKHLEDYFALIIATHLLAGAEAFVAAQLWDLPEHVSIKAFPFGPVLAASIRW